MLRLLLPALLVMLTACSSLRPPGGGPAPVENRDVPRGETSGTPRTVGPPLPPDFDSRDSPQEPPRSAPAATLLAQVDEAAASGDFERAAALAERALRIAPRDAQAWYALADIQFRQRRYADA